MSKKLNRNFFSQETTKVACNLLGKTLVRTLQNGEILKGIIVETEAYLGLLDPCCHSFHQKRTPRTQVMYQLGGVAYVYFTYGMHYCLNVVTAQKDQPEAVLIRSIYPTKNICMMLKNRRRFTKNISSKNITNGPAKLCQAMKITKTLNGISLQSDQLYVEDAKPVNPRQIQSSSRVGLKLSEPAAYWPLRFYIHF